MRSPDSAIPEPGISDPAGFHETRFCHPRISRFAILRSLDVAVSYALVPRFRDPTIHVSCFRDRAIPESAVWGSTVVRDSRFHERAIPEVAIPRPQIPRFRDIRSHDSTIPDPAIPRLEKHNDSANATVRPRGFRSTRSVIPRFGNPRVRDPP